MRSDIIYRSPQLPVHEGSLTQTVVGSPAPTPSVVITNVLPDDNRGGCALTLAAIDFVRASWPGARITLLSVGSGEPSTAFRHTLRRHPDVAVVPPLFPANQQPLARAVALTCSLMMVAFGWRIRGSGVSVETWRALRGADVVLSRGGVIFKLRSRHWGHLLTFWFTTLPIQLATTWRKPVVLLGAQIGPFPRRIAARLVGRTLGRAMVVNTRGPLSSRAATECAGKARPPDESPDSVLRLRPASPDFSTADRLLAALGLDAGTRFVAITTAGDRSASALENTTRFMAELVRRLVDTHEVEVIVLTLQVGGGRDSDLTACEKLERAVLDEGIRVVTIYDDVDPLVLAAIYGRSRAVIASRMHAAVLGLCAGVPSFPVVLEDHYRKEDVYAGLGLREWVLDPFAGVDRAAEQIGVLDERAAELEQRMNSWETRTEDVATKAAARLAAPVGIIHRS